MLLFLYEKYCIIDLWQEVIYFKKGGINMCNEMFCFQCQETMKGTGCTIAGVCGKKPATASLQDLLVYT